jgi:hypothetical protein
MKPALFAVLGLLSVPVMAATGISIDALVNALIWLVVVAGHYEIARALAPLPDEPHLHPVEVLRIRASSKTTNALAREYGVSNTAIRYIRTGVNWRHL